MIDFDSWKAMEYCESWLVSTLWGCNNSAGCPLGWLSYLMHHHGFDPPWSNPVGGFFLWSKPRFWLHSVKVCWIRVQTEVWSVYTCISSHRTNRSWHSCLSQPSESCTIQTVKMWLPLRFDRKRSHLQKSRDIAGKHRWQRYDPVTSGTVYHRKAALRRKIPKINQSALRTENQTMAKVYSACGWSANVSLLV